MNRTDFMNHYFRYYLLLEKKFIATLNYVELAKENFSTFSVEYAHQLLAIGSELDTFFKIYCGFNLEDRKNISDYTQYILNDYPEITSQKVQIDDSDIVLTPYDEWTQWKPQSKNLLSWWDSYNSVKHNRQENLLKASMGNVVTSLSALYLIEMKYLQKISVESNEPDEPESRSDLFTLTDWKFRLSIVEYFFNTGETGSQ